MNVRRWLPPLLWAGVILFVTSVPQGVVPRAISPFDKAVHAVMYAVFAVLLSRQISEVTGPGRATLLAIVIAAAFGAVDEWHQRYVPGRSSEIADWRADSMGAAGGAIVFALYRRVRRSRAPIAK